MVITDNGRKAEILNSCEVLVAAGRYISVTDKMWDITRVIPVCAVTGEAAGTAAAMTDCFSQLDVSVLQKRLERRGAVMHCQFD